MRRITADENKKLLVEMMLDFTKYLDENNIKYFLAYGTLLGAVRHKGFIPWDDDVDLLIPRKDFIKLIHLLEKDKEYLATKDLEILEFSYRPKTYHKRFKIANTRTTMEEYGAMRSAVFIDIFPLDCFKSVKQAKNKSPFVMFLSNVLTFCHAGTVVASGTKGAMYKAILGFNKLLGLKRMEKFYEKLQLSIVKEKEKGVFGYSESYDDSRYYTDVSHWKDTIKLEFEGKEFSCPAGYDAILTSWYGDYMTPPPPEGRFAHDGYVMYWKD